MTNVWQARPPDTTSDLLQFSDTESATFVSRNRPRRGERRDHPIAISLKDFNGVELIVHKQEQNGIKVLCYANRPKALTRFRTQRQSPSLDLELASIECADGA